MDRITEKPLDINKYLAQAHHEKAGAVVLFSGEVRNHSKGKEVLYLEYECHKEIAEKLINEILDDAINKWSLHFALCVHRVGKIDITESAVVVITASSHREEAYTANRYIIDRVKKEAPIWKKEFFADGSKTWR